LLSGGALVAVILSSLAGLATLVLVYSRHFETARYTAAAAVAAIIAGWAVARWPTILPGLTVYRAAAGHDTLVWIVVAVLGGGAILFPSLALLFRLTLTGRFQALEQPDEELEDRGALGVRPRMMARLAVAFLIAGLGLLNVAEASWTHAVGVVSFAGFIVAGFLAVVSDALRSEEAAQSGGGP
jgi:cytochrome d ubiquinol oxidase subunit II